MNRARFILVTFFFETYYFAFLKMQDCEKSRYCPEARQDLGTTDMTSVRHQVS